MPNLLSLKTTLAVTVSYYRQPSLGGAPRTLPLASCPLPLNP